MPIGGEFLNTSGLFNSVERLQILGPDGTDDVQSQVEVSTDLSAWLPAVRLSAVPDGSGGIQEMWRSQDPITEQSRYFIHLKFVVP